LAFTTYPTGTNTGPDPYGWNYSGLPDSSLLQWYPDLAIGSFTGQNQAAWSVSGNSSYVVLGGEFPQVNGVNQQGLVRFAVSSIAPNLKGPRTLATMTPTATSPSAGTARVTWQATWDQDNQYLTYNVYRDGGSTPAYTTTQASNFWQMPTMSFLDTGLSPGSKHSYVVKVSDPFKNIRTSPVSNTVTMSGTAPANQPPVASIALPSCVQLVCSFDGSGSTDPDGTIVSYGWAFGDGVVGNGATLSHTYASAGTYAVSLTVTDNSGATATKSISVTVTGTPSTLYAQDSFARTVANGWGSANLGGAWSASGSAYTVAAGVGATALATAGSGASTFLNGVSKSDTDVQVSVTTDKAPTGGGIYVYVIGRRITGQGDYRAKVQLVSSGAVKVSLTRTSSTGVETDLTSATVAGLTYVPGTSLRVRLQVTGTGPTSLRAKVWVAGTTEPAAWAVSATDATAGLQAAGSVGVGDYLSGSATNAPVVVRFDDFQAGPTH
jgi:PKD repeat protein